MVERRRRALLRLETLEDRTAPALLGHQLFPTDNPWNQRITDAPVAANSAAILQNILQRSGDGRLHPDFGQLYGNGSDLYGIPYNVVRGNSQPKVPVVIDAYPDESDLQDVPIPDGAVLEGDYQNGPKFGVNARGDSHLLLYDVDNNLAYELYRASRPAENADGRWHADQLTVWDLNTNQFRTLGWTSADAAGLAILPGLVRPDEALPVSQGGQGVIQHAIRFTLQNAIILNEFLYPASHTANPGNTNAAIQPPMGARFRLKASKDISHLEPQSRIIAQAMKDYGMILADNGSNFYFSGASYAVDASNQVVLTFDDDDIQHSVRGLKSLRFSDFEVVDLTPAITGLSVTTGPAGTTVTVHGHNFSGAAGRLEVLFGTIPASSVQVLDDRQIVAVVPEGSGTVDVRVQSGVLAPGQTRNYTDPIFGYGISPVTAAARFTYGDSPGTNLPPTVAVPAAASPAQVRVRWTTLTVQGADDGGAANLRYTWRMQSGPADALPVFGSNGTTAARRTTVLFDRAGSYVFEVTITDSEGLTATSTVSVTVLQKLRTIRVTPAPARVAPRGRVWFSANGYDQFGHLLEQQPAFTWRVVSGPGTITRDGLYRAPARVGANARVEVRSGGIRGWATILVRRGAPGLVPLALTEEW